uniref:Uncharacterized protein n=1 Tax=Romanomermis culicivorax TaxID=13658 RepID=A0A915K6D0_ROMCU
MVAAPPSPPNMALYIHHRFRFFNSVPSQGVFESQCCFHSYCRNSR